MFYVKESIDSVAKNLIDQDEETDPNFFSDMSDVEVDFPEVEEQDFSNAPAEDIFSSSSLSDDIDSLDNDDDNTTIIHYIYNNYYFHSFW